MIYEIIIFVMGLFTGAFIVFKFFPYFVKIKPYIEKGKKTTGSVFRKLKEVDKKFRH